MIAKSDSALVGALHPSPNFELRRGVGQPDMLLLHYTGLKSCAKAIDWLSRPESKVSCHYVVDEAGQITQMVAEDQRAWHAGLASWHDETDINSASVGIEIHNPGHELGYPEFPEAQMLALEALCADIIARHRIRPERVLAHSDVAPKRKKDPGEKFPWARLAGKGIGHWVPPVAVLAADPGIARDAAGPLVADVQGMLARYGYGIQPTGGFDPLTEFVVTAFQRHFRPERVDGRIDQSTITTLERLAAVLPAPAEGVSSMSHDGAAPTFRPADRLDALAILVLLVCCACWGINQSAIKIAGTGISPILQAGLRSVFAGLLVFAWAGLRGVRLFERDRTLWPGLLVGSMFSLEFLILYVGLDQTSASRGVVFLYLSPFVVAFGAHFLIPGDRLTVPKVLGLSAAFVGLAVAVGESFTAPGRPTLTGDLLCLLAAVLWGATTVMIRATALKSAAPEKTLLYQLLISGLVLPPASVALGEPGIRELGPAALLAFAYTVIIVAFVSYIAWFWLVRNYPPTRVTAFTFLSPVFGVIAGNLMLGEAFTPSLGVALVLIAFGIYLVNRPAR